MVRVSINSGPYRGEVQDGTTERAALDALRARCPGLMDRPTWWSSTQGGHTNTYPSWDWAHPEDVDDPEVSAPPREARCQWCGLLYPVGDRHAERIHADCLEEVVGIRERLAEYEGGVG